MLDPTRGPTYQRIRGVIQEELDALYLTAISVSYDTLVI